MARVQFVAAWLVVLATQQLVSTAPATVITAPTSDREALAPVFGKKFIIDKCDNMAEVLQVFGINKTLTKVFERDFTFTIVLDEDNGEYTLTKGIYRKVGSRLIKIKSAKIPFRIGQKMRRITPKGVEVEAVFTQDANTLTEVRSGKYAGTTVRTFSPEQVKTTIKMNGAVNDCVYKPE